MTPAGPLVGKLMGQPPNLRELISSADGVTFWAKHDKAIAELGYSPRGLEEGLRETLSSARASSERRARRSRAAWARGISAAAAITAAKAAPRARPSTSAGADRVAEDEHPAEDRGAVGGDRGGRDHRDRLAELHPAGEREEGAEAADHGEHRPGAEQGDRCRPPRCPR